MKINELLEGSDIWDGNFTLTDYHKTIHAPRIVKGNCNFYNIGISSLKGSPEEVHGAFVCSCNSIKSLEYGPKIVKGVYRCFDNKLKNLVGAPSIITGVFDVSSNPITSLEGAPHEIHGLLDISHCHALKSLHNIHKQIKIVESIRLINTKIKQQILGLLMIPSLKKIEYDSSMNDVFSIIEKYIESSDPPMIKVNKCQDELIEAGLEDFAEL